MQDDDSHKIGDDHPEGFGNAPYNWVPDFVYGGIDGAVTTFAVVAGVEGASLSLPIILILGFANLFADGFSMAASKYSSDKAQQEQYEKIKQIEYRHLKERTEHEKDEIRQILGDYGFKGHQLECTTEAITSNPDAWVDMMMRYEFNMTHENIDPIKGALATFIAFIVIGIIPLIAYVLQPMLNLESRGLFIFAAVATFFALFVVGAVKSRFIIKGWFLSGLETALLGGLAASISYLIGFLLRGIAM
jgi:VIT1/CCC1 family predicted Fe2+/Mn2+ transporter